LATEYQIVLIDLKHTKRPNEVVEEKFSTTAWYAAGKRLCDESDYDTFKVQKVIKKRKPRTTKSKKVVAIKA